MARPKGAKKSRLTIYLTEEGERNIDKIILSGYAIGKSESVEWALAYAVSKISAEHDTESLTDKIAELEQIIDVHTDVINTLIQRVDALENANRYAARALASEIPEYRSDKDAGV